LVSGFHRTNWYEGYDGTYVKYSNMEGNRGITGAAIIETSHIVMHIWDEVHPALMQFDVYSCGEFDPETICDKIDKDFTVHKIEYKFLDREHDLKEIHKISYKQLNHELKYDSLGY